MVFGNDPITVVAARGTAREGRRGLAKARNDFGQRSQLISRRLELFEEVGAKGFVGRRDEAGGIVRCNAGQSCDLAAGQRHFYCGETRCARDMCRACPGRKGRLVAAAHEGDAGGGLLGSP